MEKQSQLLLKPTEVELGLQVGVEFDNNARTEMVKLDSEITDYKKKITVLNARIKIMSERENERLHGDPLPTPIGCTSVSPPTSCFNGHCCHQAHQCQRVRQHCSSVTHTTCSPLPGNNRNFETLLESLTLRVDEFYSEFKKVQEKISTLSAQPKPSHRTTAKSTPTEAPENESEKHLSPMSTADLEEFQFDPQESSQCLNSTIPTTQL